MPWKGIYVIFLNQNFLSFWGQNVATVWKSHDLAGDELSATSFRSLMEKYAVRNGAKENTPTETWLIKYNWQQAQETMLFRRYFLVQMSFCSPPSDVVLFSLLPFLFQVWWNCWCLKPHTHFAWAPVFYRCLVRGKKEGNWNFHWFQPGYHC